MGKTDQRLIYRITHAANVPWILDHGLYAGASTTRDPNFVRIGNAELIDKRRAHPVPLPPGGTLADYVPFYFCKHSVMLYQIHTGQIPGVDVSQREVVYLVSSVEKLMAEGVRFLFTDRHAYVISAIYYADTAHLSALDWRLIESRDFRRAPDDPGKGERRIAEALVHHHLPLPGLLGLACYDDAACMTLKREVAGRGLDLPVAVRREWDF